MNGPFIAGTLDCSFQPAESAWESNFMKRGCVYKVTQSFVDADGDEHTIGQEWTFLASIFSKSADELTLYVRTPSQQEWTIPLIWKPEAQAKVIEHFHDYVHESL